MSKLEDTFNIEPTGDNADELYTVCIPDDADLDVVAKLALEAYKSQIESIMVMEPKYRSRALEVARQFLDVAKDAMSKDQELQLKWRKLDGTEEGKREVLIESGEKTRNAILVDFQKKRMGRVE